MDLKTCKKCGNDKPLPKFQRHLKFFKKKNKEDYYYYPICLDCNKSKKSKQDKNYRTSHKVEKALLDKEYHFKNKDEISRKKKEYYKFNKLQFLERNLRNEKKRRLSDPAFRLKKCVSASIRKCINKKNFSFTKFVPYSIQELKEHLEKQFEPWMNWNNQGVYKIDKWNDSDRSTWKWNIDHIIPQSTFKYTSMEDQEFKNCWALSNLRPYSAKQNIIDGDRY